jgi:hypothetical protein
MIFKPNGFLSLNQGESPCYSPWFKIRYTRVLPLFAHVWYLHFGKIANNRQFNAQARPQYYSAHNTVLYSRFGFFIYQNYRKFNTHAVQQYHLSVVSSHVMFNTMYLCRYRTGIPGITQKKNNDNKHFFK